MPTVDKISALRSYQSVLDKVEPGNPVFLTKNGTGKFLKSFIHGRCYACTAATNIVRHD